MFQACTFLARSDLRKPSSRLAYSISDHVKPRARANISAEMKLGSFSFRILDSLCGTVSSLVYISSYFVYYIEKG